MFTFTPVTNKSTKVTVKHNNKTSFVTLKNVSTPLLLLQEAFMHNQTNNTFSPAVIAAVAEYVTILKKDKTATPCLMSEHSDKAKRTPLFIKLKGQRIEEIRKVDSIMDLLI